MAQPPPHNPYVHMNAHFLQDGPHAHRTGGLAHPPAFAPAHAPPTYAQPLVRRVHHVMNHRPALGRLDRLDAPPQEVLERLGLVPSTSQPQPSAPAPPPAPQPPRPQPQPQQPAEQTAAQQGRCPICLDSLYDSADQAQPSSSARAPPCETPCGHLFHRPCLEHWLTLQNTCPECRNRIDVYKGRTLEERNLQLPPEYISPYSDTICKICHHGDNESLLLLCDGCDSGFHTFCLRPKLNAVPQDCWYCPSCRPRMRQAPARASIPTPGLGLSQDEFGLDEINAIIRAVEGENAGAPSPAPARAPAQRRATAQAVARKRAAEEERGEAPSTSSPEAGGAGAGPVRRGRGRPPKSETSRSRSRPQSPPPERSRSRGLRMTRGALEENAEAEPVFYSLPRGKYKPGETTKDGFVISFISERKRGSGRPRKQPVATPGLGLEDQVGPDETPDVGMGEAEAVEGRGHTMARSKKRPKVQKNTAAAEIAGGPAAAGAASCEDLDCS